MSFARRILAWSVALLAICAMASADAEEPAPEQAVDPAGAEFFEKQIRPVLVEHCYKCHSAKAIKLRGQLRLDSRQGVVKGGEGGPVIIPGDPDQSRLIQAIRWTDDNFQMPPKEKLTAEQIGAFEHWVKMGAPDPRDESKVAGSAETPKPLSLEEAAAQLWVLKPIGSPEVPTGVTQSTNPIDAFIAAEYQAKGLTPVGQADRATLLRRVYLDLVGIPPSPAEQNEFLSDTSPNSYEKVVDRLLSSPQHGVRYARHWLDVLRYADVDERMIAAPGIHLWRDWVINALNDDVPYDQFVRAQLTGYRSTVRTQMSATGYRSKADPRPDDLFALGLLARGAVIRDGKGTGELAISAVETVSSAFMGLTVACAKCHDHVYDPIRQRDFYAMKALFDPLVPRRINLASAEELVASGRASQEAAARRAPIEDSINKLVEPYKKKLYDDRVTMLPREVQVIIRKSEQERSAAEQKTADDYFPILRIDGDKITAVMPEEDRKRYQELQRELGDATQAVDRQRGGLPTFWTVEADPKKETEKSYVLTSGDPERPELNHEVSPGWPFASSSPEFREGRVEAFSDWLTASENPLFTRVAVNRLWQWHFGEGLHKTPSDFGKLSGAPSHPKLLDYLAAELIRQKFSMKALHRLIVTSQTYQLASQVDSQLAARNAQIDPASAYLWRFPLQRLEAEPIWDSIFTAAGSLDQTVGGPSFSVGAGNQRRGRRGRQSDDSPEQAFRRAAYITRGYSTSRDVMPNFLSAFDVDDGRAACPERTQTVTATQSLFLMNSDEVQRATAKFSERLLKESGGDLPAAVDLGYRIALARRPSAKETERALAYLENDPAKLQGLAWLLFNLDEFIYVR
jgi:hypothetical protein